jgi:prephenate dehydrogenase
MAKEQDMTVGIIGQGSFGRFAAEVLSSHGKAVVVFDKTAKAVPKGAKRVSLTSVAKTDILVLAVPLSSYDTLLPKLRPLLSSETLVVDICSVKTEPHKRLRRHLQGHPNLLITHPVFGPQSAASGTAGHVLVVTESFGERADKVIDFCRKQLGLKIMRMSDEAHDRAMADVHALTFFLARGLSRTGLAKSPFQAPSFQLLLDLIQLDQSHSEDLFRTIELGNPYAGAARDRFLAALTEVNEQLA